MRPCLKAMSRRGPPCGSTAARGLAPDGVEKHDGVCKYVFHDADGYETGVGGEVESIV